MTDDTDRGRSAERASELIDRVGGQSASRRAFLGNTAKVGGGALTLSAIGGPAAAHKSDDSHGGDKSGDGMDGDMNGDDEVTDLDVLNYALTLEHLEATYYNEFLSEYSESEVENSSVAKVLTGGGNDRYTVYQKIQQVRDHEEAHVDTLTETIEKLGGEPVEAAEYSFPYESIEEFAALSATIEAVGVSAYAGAAPLIENADLIPPALSIHSVEARHTAYFNVLNTTNPFPDAFDEPRTMEEVLAIASDFIEG
jgi:rubrerythrin